MYRYEINLSIILHSQFKYGNIACSLSLLKCEFLIVISIGITCLVVLISLEVLFSLHHIVKMSLRNEQFHCFVIRILYILS